MLFTIKRAVHLTLVHSAGTMTGSLGLKYMYLNLEQNCIKPEHQAYKLLTSFIGIVISTNLRTHISSLFPSVKFYATLD